MQMSRPVLPDASLPLTTAESSALGPLLAYGRAHASQLIRFVLIGAGVMSLNLALLYCLRALTRLPAPVAVALVYVFGTLFHLSAHRWFSYGVQDRPIRPQGLRYAVMLVCNFLILQ